MTLSQTHKAIMPSIGNMLHKCHYFVLKTTKNIGRQNLGTVALMKTGSYAPSTLGNLTSIFFKKIITYNFMQRNFITGRITEKIPMINRKNTNLPALTYYVNEQYLEAL
jgi:hypothetical protein